MMAFSYPKLELYMPHDEEQPYSYRAFLAALDLQTCPLIMLNCLAKLAAAETIGSSK